MTNDITKQMSGVSCLTEIEQKIVKLMAKYYQMHTRIGFVSGPLGIDGKDKIHENIEKLCSYTEEIRQQEDYPVFSSVDIFTDELHERVSGSTIACEDWLEFWRHIIEAGYITDLFMAPRWQLAKGAIDEYETAKKLGLEIHYAE